ncbi:hypothetical protein BGX21_008659 [Mortierella sp. AD011]|nr:hypothetical protein BGX20_009228 [Mortierella sp. AD010]KAF9397622.1 hypothetical protein BGX21_008659 [Mortierella sp. AD011]
MSIILSQTSIALQNPYSVLEPEYEPSTTTVNDIIVQYDTSSKAMLTRATSDDDLDRISVSSWSVVNSTYGSDNEGDDEDNTEEIYIDASGNQIAPLTVSALSGGFTNISKTTTATSINSSSAAAAQPDVWVVKVSKKRQQSSNRKPRSHAATVPSLEDVIEEGLESDEEEGELHMPMSEHELSKSSKAVNLKNIRLATTHDIELCRALNITARHSSGPKLPKSSFCKSKNQKAKVSTD